MQRGAKLSETLPLSKLQPIASRIINKNRSDVQDRNSGDFTQGKKEQSSDTSMTMHQAAMTIDLAGMNHNMSHNESLDSLYNLDTTKDNMI